MEVVAATPSNGSPFHNHDVREWSRLDSLTGVLERARLETDQWSANTATSSHKYNKVVDSRARSGADGNHQQQARRKLEVFQSQVPGGRIQVIKTQTVSSSRWTNKTPIITHPNEEDYFEDLQLSLNPLDLTSEKSKASVGRSVGRRPPSRSRIRDDILARNIHTTAATNLHRVSRLCHQIHDSAVKKTFGKYNNLPINERQSGDGVEIVEIEHENGHYNLSRTKSTSSEDLQDAKKSLEDLEDLEQLQNWRRTSKIRRSLQYPKQKTSNNKPPDLPENTGSVRKIREDLETGKRLNTALRGNSVDLDALDQILKSISNSSVSSSFSDQRYEEPEKDEIANSKKQKRNSFVTVESLQAVRDRLRRTSSPGSDIYRNEKEEIDDGIVTEDLTNSKTEMATESRVKSYVYGMENVQKKTISGTGSLESRSKPSNLSINRNEDWFSRRKSYGFEQMHNQQECISSKNKTRVESSTDSGICRSTEIVLVPTPTKTNDLRSEYTSESDEELKQVFKEDNLGNVKKFTSLFENRKPDPYSCLKTSEDRATSWNKRGFSKDKELEGTTITIPIVSNGKTWRENGEVKRHSIAVDESKYMSVVDNKFKRTSLAINDKYEEDDDNSQSKKHNKKVEFCKTEVHFAADSGKVNIVETDEKPPPTQNFRRRRRNQSVQEIKSDLPVLHFGDTSYEKLLFADAEEYPNDGIYENLNKEVIACGNVTVNANGTYQEIEEQKENIENEAPRGILKNKPIKPKPYILGDNEDILRNTDSDSEKTWGVKLRPTQKEDSPIWRSTVTVRNTFFGQNENTFKETENPQPEFKKLLQQLRPTTKSDTESSPENKRNSENLNNIRILSPIIDTRRSSWSVADRVKQVEDLKWTENKGYSTKVNFGEGEATVIENRHPTWPRKDEFPKESQNTRLDPEKDNQESKFHFIDKQIENNINLNEQVEKSNISIAKSSPKIIRKPIQNVPLKSAFATDKLSSPFLVGRNKSKSYAADQEIERIYEENMQNIQDTIEENITNLERSKSPKAARGKSPVKEHSVLRQPKKSEMAYFGVNVSPKPKLKETKILDKPDLLQFNSIRDNKPKTKIYAKPKETPIYENIEQNKNRINKFDSSILEELTKAADQILQAVNGYTDEEHQNKFSSDEEKKSKHMLDTISETKSWKQTGNTKVVNKVSTTRTKIKQTSSNSSIESISRECRKSSSGTLENRKPFMTKSAEQKQRKKVVNGDTTKAATKARRLQRASSREALLQSHGSSSEDLSTPVEVVRKPRMIKKTKTSTLTVSNGMDLKKPAKKREEVKRADERVPVIGLPEIRHKTAVSTIRSTAEKAASREKAKLKTDEIKKRQSGKREVTKGVSTSTSKPERIRSSSSRDVVSQRHPSANLLKKSTRNESSITKH